MSWRHALNLAAALLGTTGCFGTPTPLAPTIAGSVGVPHHGVQTNGTELPKSGKGYRRFRIYGRHYYGNPRLVSALERVAAEVWDEFGGGPPLLLGDLSSETGGKIPRHNSHRTGRDVDLLWYVTTPAGAPIQNPGFVRIGPDGLAVLADTGDYVRLDIERQWRLVRRLLSSPDIHVQWMFCSREIEALLIDYARALGEAPELVWHAETVLLQPGDSLAHDDHIHMRIACTPDEAVRGCEGGGPYWEWLPPLPRLDRGDDWVYTVMAADPFDPGGDTSEPSERPNEGQAQGGTQDSNAAANQPAG